MHHRFVANGIVGYGTHTASLVDDDVLDIILKMRKRDGMNLALPLVGFGMRSETGGQGIGEIVRPKRVQFVGDLVRQGTTFNRRKDSTGMTENVRVDGEVVVLDGTLAPLFSERFRDRFRTDPAIAVPLRPAVPQPHAVHHARAKEPTVLAIVDAAHKIRTVAQIAAIQL
jgi:hypothetical protein